MNPYTTANLPASTQRVPIPQTGEHPQHPGPTVPVQGALGALGTGVVEYVVHPGSALPPTGPSLLVTVQSLPTGPAHSSHPPLSGRVQVMRPHGGDSTFPYRGSPTTVTLVARHAGFVAHLPTVSTRPRIPQEAVQSLHEQSVFHPVIQTPDIPAPPNLQVSSQAGLEVRTLGAKPYSAEELKHYLGKSAFFKSLRSCDSLEEMADEFKNLRHSGMNLSNTTRSVLNLAKTLDRQGFTGPASPQTRACRTLLSLWLFAEASPIGDDLSQLLPQEWVLSEALRKQCVAGWQATTAPGREAVAAIVRDRYAAPHD